MIAILASLTAVVICTSVNAAKPDPQKVKATLTDIFKNKLFLKNKLRKESYAVYEGSQIPVPKSSDLPTHLRPSRSDGVEMEISKFASFWFRMADASKQGQIEVQGEAPKQPFSKQSPDGYSVTIDVELGAKEAKFVCGRSGPIEPPDFYFTGVRTTNKKRLDDYDLHTCNTVLLNLFMENACRIGIANGGIIAAVAALYK